MKLKVGDKVKWICRPYQLSAQECTGIIISFKQSTFGSQKKALGAKIAVETKFYKERFNKDFAFICVDNLKKS